MILQAIEGVYRNGTVELTEVPTGISESRVVVTFLQAESTPQVKAIMRFGMFAGLNQSTEEDFRSAEFMGDSDDKIDWS